MSPHVDGSIKPVNRPARLRTVAGVGLVAAAGGLAWLGTAGPQDSVNAWVAREPVAATGTVTRDQFDLVEVTLPEPAVLWPAGSQPSGTAVRPLRPGEPLLTSDVSEVTDPGDRQVTIPVAPERLPVDLTTGDVIDVWQPAAAAPLLPDVVVLQVAPPDVGPARIEVAVPTAAVRAAVQAAGHDQLVVVRHR